MSLRDAVGRVITAAVVAVALLAALSVSDLRPDPVAIVLLTLLGVFGLGLVLDGFSGDTTIWDAPHRPATTHGRDPVVEAHQRVLANHLTARSPGGELRERLARLADAVLVTRHGVGRHSEAGRALLGPELIEVLDGAPRRLRLSTIEASVRRIEEL